MEQNKKTAYKKPGIAICNFDNNKIIGDVQMMESVMKKHGEEIRKEYEKNKAAAVE